MTCDIHLVDTFTRPEGGGRRLCVVVHDGDLTSADMRARAADLDSATAAFVERDPRSSGARRLHAFASTGETPFSGHAALGAAWVLRTTVVAERPEAVDLEMPMGDVQVRFEADERGEEIGWLAAPTIEVGSAWPRPEVDAVLGLRGVTAAGLSPPQLLTAGLSILVVPVPGLQQLRACTLNGPAFKGLAVRLVRVRALRAVVYAYCAEAHEAGHDIAARLLRPDAEELEEPASGTAAACLGVYLLQHGGLAAADGQVLVEQGYEMGEPSLLRVRSSRQGARIEVGGTVCPAEQSP